MPFACKKSGAELRGPPLTVPRDEWLDFFLITPTNSPTVLLGQGCRVHGSGVVYHDCAGLVIEEGIEERAKNVGQNGGWQGRRPFESGGRDGI